MDDLVLNWDLGTGGLLILAVASIAALLVMIMALRMHAFLALLITSLLTAVAAGIPPPTGSSRRSASASTRPSAT